MELRLFPHPQESRSRSKRFYVTQRYHPRPRQYVYSTRTPQCFASRSLS